jgi:hypothetical protein
MNLFIPASSAFYFLSKAFHSAFAFIIENYIYMSNWFKMSFLHTKLLWFYVFIIVIMIASDSLLDNFGASFDKNFIKFNVVK